MAEGKDVFISYHRATMAETLRRIADELKNRGISSWYDTESPKPGHFTETIEEEIKACKVFLFIWDDGANNSTWCRDEVLSALAHGKHIFLFRVGTLKTDNAELNFRLRAFQRFDVDNPPDQERIQNLAETIADTLRGSRPTWKMIYEREQQLEQLESRLEVEQASAKDAMIAKERRIAKLEENLQQADSLIQAVKNKLGQKQTQIQRLQDLQEQAQLLSDELSQEQNWIQEICQDKVRIHQDYILPQINHRLRRKRQTKNHKKIIISFIIVISLLISSVIGYLCNHTIGILDRNGTLRVYGIGSITKVSYPFQSVTNSEVSSIIIPNSATSIKEGTFRDHPRLTTVIIPDSVSVIENWSFSLCPNLKSVSISANAQIYFNSFPTSTIVLRRPLPE